MMGRLAKGGVIAAALAVGLSALPAGAQENAPQQIDVQDGKIIIKSTAAGIQVEQAEETPTNKADADGPAPKIEAEKSEHNFGETWAGTKIEHTFQIRNAGDAPLVISKVRPSCGCTLAGQYDKEIAPGATGNIPVAIDTSKLKNAISKVVTVESNDPVIPQFRLTIAGTIKERFKIEPSEGQRNPGDFGRLRPDEELKRTLTLTNQMDQPIKLELPRAKYGVFETELVEKEPGKVYELNISAKPPYEENLNRALLKLHTNLPDKTTVDLNLLAQVPPRWEVTPSPVLIPKAVDRVRNQSVRVKFNESEPRRVLSASVDAENVGVEVKELAPSHYDVVLSLPENWLPATTGHKLSIKTDDPKQPELTVEIAQKPAAQTPQRPSMQLSGKPVPDAQFTLAGSDAKISTLEMKDNATLLMFYASWCGFCKRALPILDQLNKEFEGKSAKIYAISMDSLKEDGDTSPRARSKQEVIDQWKDLKISLPQAFDSDGAGKGRFLVQSFPTLFLLDKSGKIQRVYVGGAEAQSGQLKTDMEALLAGKPLPEQKVQEVAAQPPQPSPTELAGKPVPKVGFRAAADDSSVSLVDSGSDATLVMFYASWCGFCKKALPVLSTMSEEMGGKARFLGVSLDTIVETPDPANRRAKTKEEVVQQWKDLGIKFPQAFDSEHVVPQEFRVRSFPTMFLINNKAGKIEKVYVGAGAVNDGSLKKDIEAIASGKSLSAAPAGENTGTR